jgi:hypothetical protein
VLMKSIQGGTSERARLHNHLSTATNMQSSYYVFNNLHPGSCAEGVRALNPSGELYQLMPTESCRGTTNCEVLQAYLSGACPKGPQEINFLCVRQEAVHPTLGGTHRSSWQASFEHHSTVATYASFCSCLRRWCWRENPKRPRRLSYAARYAGHSTSTFGCSRPSFSNTQERANASHPP